MKAKVPSTKKKASKKISLEFESAEEKEMFDQECKLLLGDEPKELKYPSRAHHRAPEKLAQLIRLVNLVPPERELPAFEILFPKFTTLTLADELSIKEGITILRNSISDLSLIFQNYVMDEFLYKEITGRPKLAESTQLFDDSIGSELIKNLQKLNTNEIVAIRRYEEFRFIRALFYEIATLALIPKEIRNLYQISNGFLLTLTNGFNDIQENVLKTFTKNYEFIGSKLLESMKMRKQFSHMTDYVIDQYGIFRVYNYPAYFFAALEGVNVTRLRMCAICQKIFWAEREDKIACQSKCAATIRKRRSRENQIKSGHLYTEAKQKKLRRK